MRVVSWASKILMIIGAVNWLLVGAARFDLVRWLFGRNTLPARTTYNLVGIAGLTQLVTLLRRVLRGKPFPATA